MVKRCITAIALRLELASNSRKSRPGFLEAGLEQVGPGTAGRQHPPGPVVGERVAVGHRAAGRVGRRAVSPAQQLSAQIVGKRAGIPLLVGLHPDSPRRVVTELDDPVPGRPHGRPAGVVRIGFPDLLTSGVVSIGGHLVLGIGQGRNLPCGLLKQR